MVYLRLELLCNTETVSEKGNEAGNSVLIADHVNKMVQ